MRVREGRGERAGNGRWGEVGWKRKACVVLTVFGYGLGM